MNYLSIENLSKSYGIRVLFKEISFGINKGQRVALVARNGTGKSSLLKIISGKDTADSGNVTFRKDIKTAFLNQEPELDGTRTVMQEVFGNNNPVLNAIREYEECLIAQENGEDDQDRFQAAFEGMEQQKAWDYETKIKQILTQLKITKLEQLTSELSGGQQKRVALAKVLTEEPDLLILDEPTNHLDFEMIEWLENYLVKQNITLLMVTHDRYFLDRVCNEIIELDNGILYTYKGNYSYFIEKKQEREFNEGQQIDKAKNLYRKELDWIRKSPKARTTKSKSRIDAFYDVEEKANSKKKEAELTLNVKMTRVGGKILELKKIYKSYDNLQILKGFDYTFKTGERIGIVGKNGTGKSTFLNIITGKEPVDSGKVAVGDTIVYGYYSQEGLKLNEDKRVIDVVKDIAEVIPLGDGSKLSASQFLQHFLFSPEIQYTYVSKLSGGEKRRLYLLTVLIKNPNFLILDEPTNDLDILTLNVLEDFLLSFKGCLIIVSHDRYFMDKLADHLFVFEGEGVIKDFTGNYSEYREWLIDREKDEKAKAKQIAIKPSAVIVEKAVEKKVSFKDKKAYDDLEIEIAKLENQKKELEMLLNSGTLNQDVLQEKALQLGDLIQTLEEKSLRWLELADLIGE
ncbi:MAG: ABC-F family ATP-binding cassette domain-containing protein [Bacteroidetes bacterium]|nr:ABC-F family ATP-binding cassette domain-containing protein [Bacteroidota bacterium]HET6243649.1 ABC-F family ATP-binding cassette domain-containing protein [Bacteroidia bacterium]